MKNLIFIVCCFMSASLWAFDGLVIKDEFERLKEHVQTLEPDYTVAFMKAKVYPNVTLLWSLDESAGDRAHEVIRFLTNKHPSGQAFSITYFNTVHIVRGKRIIRRFYGPDATGWRNDTVDFNTGEIIGQQGTTPLIYLSDVELAAEWGITLPQYYLR